MNRIILALTFVVSSFFSHSQNQWEVPVDFLDFDNDNEGILSIQIDTLDSLNIWQITQPAKLFLDSAYSPMNALITDRVNDYPINCNSVANINITENYLNEGWFEFKHKFDTDTLKDGGIIEMSCDDGESWVNIIESCFSSDMNPSLDDFPNFVQYQNNSESTLYTATDTLFNGDFGFSGNSGGWITTWFGWHHLAIKSKKSPNSFRLRFRFLSDSLETNNEGWMIDDIKFYYISIPGSISKNKIHEFSFYPNPITSTATIELKKNYNNISIKTYNSNGQLIRNDLFKTQRSLSYSKGDLPKGFYWIEITADSESLGYKKVIVE